MSAMTLLRTPLFLALVWLALLGGCARIPSTGITSLKPANLPELQNYLLKNKADVELFRLRGPFEVTVQKDHGVQVSAADRFPADLYLSSPAEKAPLVILLHGFENTKEDHAYQAFHLATWGIHCLAVQLPNKGPWSANAKILASIVRAIVARPEMIDRRIDANRIVLAGHSFGASSVAMALADGAPAVGGVLLDPAGIGKELIKFLRQVVKPLMVVAADENVVRVRDRGLFYEVVRSGIVEISIRDAHHDDAEFPMEPGSDSSATETHQVTFVSVLTSAAFSLGVTGKLDYAWTSLGNAIQNGKLYDALRK
jgi:pimeloyl-ACP methyl ester carboxylesterase